MMYRTKGREKIDVDDTAGGVSLDTTKITSAVVYAKLQCQVAIIRVTLDGTAPVAATTGFMFYPGDFFEVWGHDALKALRAIEESTTNGVLEVLYMGAG